MIILEETPTKRIFTNAFGLAWIELVSIVANEHQTTLETSLRILTSLIVMTSIRILTLIHI
jgi:hypothetical protein